ncbi:hypothetical protein MesoLjLa_62180 [Mesorhizobium sp. L-2-11]|nr:hypothetical protein MesoLjLa_62180 [Mesorhizobium sp. L-2-11]
MRAWANYVNPVKAENVVPIHERFSVLDSRRPPRSRLGGVSRGRLDEEVSRDLPQARPRNQLTVPV